jgi:hypothetical protein
LVGVVLLVQILITYPIKTTITKKGNKLIVDKVSAFFVKSKHEFNFKETSLIIKNLSGPFFSNSYGVGIKSNKDSVSLYDGFLSRGEEGAVFGLFSKEIINKIASFLGLKIKEVD